MRPRFLLFFTGLAQCALVGLNTWQIAHQMWLGCMFVGFGISYLWTWNVKRVAFGTHLDRVIYAAGAAVGVLIGLGTAVLLYEII